MGKLALGCLGILIVVVLIVGDLVRGDLQPSRDPGPGRRQAVGRGREPVPAPRGPRTQPRRRPCRAPPTFEKETLTAVTEARASVGRATVTPGKAPTDPETLAKYQAAQDQLGSALQRLLVVSERYPELKANQNFRDLQAQLEGTENRITVARGRFNDSAQAYNTVLKKFPTNFDRRHVRLQGEAVLQGHDARERSRRRRCSSTSTIPRRPRRRRTEEASSETPGGRRG